MRIKQDNVSNNDTVNLKDWINVRESDHLWKAWCPEPGRAGFNLCLDTLAEPWFSHLQKWDSNT